MEVVESITAKEVVGVTKNVVNLCIAIYEAYEAVNLFPDLAERLLRRVQVFEPRLNQMIEEPAYHADLELLKPHIIRLHELLGDVWECLKKLKGDSKSDKVQRVLLYKGLLKECAALGTRLDQCRDDLNFDIEFDRRADMKAFEKEMLALMTHVAQQGDKQSQELELQRHMLMGMAAFVREQREENNEEFSERFYSTVEDICPEVKKEELENILKKYYVTKGYEISDITVDFDNVIGRGSFGTIYKARLKDRDEDRDVAVKVPHKGDGTILMELNNQMRCCDFVYVAHVYGFTRLNDVICMVMEFAPCGSLASLLAEASGEGGIVSVTDGFGLSHNAEVKVFMLIQLFYHISLGIEFLHQRQIIHRDIKPDNILLVHDPEGKHIVPRLSDFGSAREIEDSASHVTGSVQGALYYMAPEVLRIYHGGTGQYTYAIDVYSFGAVMNVACQKLFGGVQYIRASPRKDSELPKIFPISISEIKDRCIKEDAAERYGRGSKSGDLVSRALLATLPSGFNQSSSYDEELVSQVATVSKKAAEKRMRRDNSNIVSSLKTSTQIEFTPRPDPQPPCWKRRGNMVLIAMAVLAIICAVAIPLALRARRSPNVEAQVVDAQVDIELRKVTGIMEEKDRIVFEESCASFLSTAFSLIDSPVDGVRCRVINQNIFERRLLGVDSALELLLFLSGSFTPTKEYPSAASVGFEENVMWFFGRQGVGFLQSLMLNARNIGSDYFDDADEIIVRVLDDSTVPKPRPTLRTTPNPSKYPTLLPTPVLTAASTPAPTNSLIPDPTPDLISPPTQRVTPAPTPTPIPLTPAPLTRLPPTPAPPTPQPPTKQGVHPLCDRNPCQNRGTCQVSGSNLVLCSCPTNFQGQFCNRQIFPNCNASPASQIGDGRCDGGAFNTPDCGYDGGDCETFNKYPKCRVQSPHLIGDGDCDKGSGYNTEDCGWDGGDCFIKEYPDCHVRVPSWVGNGSCNKDHNNEACGWDGGDCIKFNEDYPDCNVNIPWYVGDGKCQFKEYNTEECGYDGGDCKGYNDFKKRYPNCDISSAYGLIGDGKCRNVKSSNSYNTEACGFDGGDCVKFNKQYPNCNVLYAYWIGNGRCNGGDYNTEECGFDGGDCGVP